MAVIAHLSDLHFGTEDPAVAEAVLDDVARLAPSLVVISGDLTQRARRRQFEKAQRFLQRLAGPQLVVPGNHDVPLFDVVRRFLAPLNRYRHFIGENVDPFYQDPEIAVLGINTAHSFTWKQGRITDEQIRRMDACFAGVPDRTFKVVVTHHPFLPPLGIALGFPPVRRAFWALPVLDRRRVDLLLAGHIHFGYSGDVRRYHPTLKRCIVASQAGTAISRRRRREANAYNCITVGRESFEIAARMWDGNHFAAVAASSFPRSP